MMEEFRGAEVGQRPECRRRDARLAVRDGPSAPEARRREADRQTKAETDRAALTAKRVVRCPAMTVRNSAVRLLNPRSFRACGIGVAEGPPPTGDPSVA
jgi:hypothetical protein